MHAYISSSPFPLPPFSFFCYCLFFVKTTEKKNLKIESKKTKEWNFCPKISSCFSIPNLKNDR